MTGLIGASTSIFNNANSRLKSLATNLAVLRCLSGKTTVIDAGGNLNWNVLVMIQPSAPTIVPVDGPELATCRLTNSAPPNVSTCTTESWTNRVADSKADCSSSSSLSGLCATVRDPAFDPKTIEPRRPSAQTHRKYSRFMQLLLIGIGFS
jgi:hypothetical protein